MYAIKSMLDEYEWLAVNYDVLYVSEALLQIQQA